MRVKNIHCEVYHFSGINREAVNVWFDRWENDGGIMYYHDNTHINGYSLQLDVLQSFLTAQVGFILGVDRDGKKYLTGTFVITSEALDEWMKAKNVLPIKKEVSSVPMNYVFESSLKLLRARRVGAAY